jgi:hypothetical protein
MLGGLQGSAKTTCARLLFRLFDPSTAETRSQPADVEQWAMAAAGSWGVVIDNVTSLPMWFSDALCKAVTGDGWVRRKLYTDSELAVLSFRRVVALTSIDAAALRGDLADRLVLVELEPIPERRRLAETEIDARFAACWPAAFGALLTLAANVLAELPRVNLAGLPRMADFARVLAALDAVAGTDALPRYLAQRKTIACDVIESDGVGAALVALAERGHWAGTAGELLACITPAGTDGKPHPGRDWPHSPRALAGRVKRLIPALRACGVSVALWREAHTGRRLVRIQKPAGEPSPSSPSSPDVPGGAENRVSAEPTGDGGVTIGATDGPYRHRNRHRENAPGAALDAVSDGGDDGDGLFGVPSEAALLGAEAAALGCPDGECVPGDVSATCPEAQGFLAEEWGDL